MDTYDANHQSVEDVDIFIGDKVFCVYWFLSFLLFSCLFLCAIYTHNTGEPVHSM